MVKTAKPTFKLQLKIKNEHGLIKPNVLAKIKINDYQNKTALIIPSIVIKQDLKGSYVYVMYKDNIAVKTYIETGMAYKGQNEVLSGINPGDAVIVAGYNQISDGARVQAVN